MGKIAHPAIALVSIAAYGYLAYEMKGTLDQHKAEIYGICALTMFAIWPWTIFIMMPTNNQLLQQHEKGVATEWKTEVTEPGTQSEKTPGGLIQKWSNLNIIRGSFMVVSAALGAWVTLA